MLQIAKIKGLENLSLWPELSSFTLIKVVVGRSGVPVPMSPLVATTLENFCVIVELGDY